MSSITRMRIINAVVWVLLMLAGSLSASHIITTADKLGVHGWQRYCAPALIDVVAIVGKLSQHVDFMEPFRRSGLRLLMAGGIVSLFCNVYAGQNIGEKAFGVLVVGAFMMLESHAAKGGQRAVVVKTRRKLAPEIAAARAAKARATREANKQAATLAAEAEMLANMTPQQRGALTRQRKSAAPVSGIPMKR